jgi:hypothetical protein
MSAKPATYNGDLAHLPPALQPLTQQDRWVIWPWEQRTKKNGDVEWTKPPRQVRNPNHNAKSNDPLTWGSYSAAVQRVADGDADGIGFMLLHSDIGAGDLDHARNAETGAIDPWAEDLHAEANGAYCEVTVSGAGLRLIGKVSGPETHRKFTFDRKTRAGIELYRNTARYITVSGLEVGSCPELPPLDGFIDAVLARFASKTGGKARTGGGMDFNDATGRQEIDYDAIIENGAPEGQRSELFQSVVWHLAAKGRSVEEIVDELACHPNGIGQKYADRLHEEVTRSYEKWRQQKHTAATGSTAPITDPWPQIYVIAGELPRVVNEAENALLLLGREIYQRGGLVVRPVLSKLKAADERDTFGWSLVPVTRPHLVEVLTCAARFLKYNGRSRQFLPIDAPDNVAETYLARIGAWKLPILTGIVAAPFLRADGSICELPGYDAASGMLFKPDAQTFPPIPLTPSKDDARAALQELSSLIDTFPFVANLDRSVALSGILTALDRRSLATAPLHALTAPVAGSGKSLLVDIISMLATGQIAPVIAQGRKDEEMDKRLETALMSGDAIISIDNCERPLESSTLCQALTQQRMKIRILGYSRHTEVLVNALVCATGNNLVVTGDLTRRTLLCSLDAKCERPELRSFNIDVLETIRAHRGRLVAAALTILRAWHIVRADERLSLSPFGSFEQWSQRIREPLVWLGCADPCETVPLVRDNDPAREALVAVVMQWEKNLGLGQPYTVQQIIGLAINSADFHAALSVVAAYRGGMLSNRNLGLWLNQVKGKIVNGLKLVQHGSLHGYPLWKLIKQAGPGWGRVG